MKKIALFDIDKTIYNGHSYFAFVKYLVERKILSENAYEEVMAIAKDGSTGKFTYSEIAQRLLVSVVAQLKGKEISELESAANDFFSQNVSEFYPYFASVIEKISNEYDIYIITANAQFAAGAVQKLFNLPGIVSSIFEVKDGKFTGEIEQSLALGKSVVKDLIDKYGKKGSIAAGDSINDRGMLELVDNAFCINASKELVELAEGKNWHIVNDQNIESEILKVVEKV